MSEAYPVRLASRMLPSDAFFWYAEAAAPELRPLVAGLFLLDRSPDPKRLRASLNDLIAAFPRLRQRVVEPSHPWGLPGWQEDLNFDFDYHFRALRLPTPASMHSLFRFASSAFSTPLDHQRPLWESTLVEGLPEGKAAVFFKAHHSLMDGVGAIPLFEALTQACPNAAVRQPRRGTHWTPPPSVSDRATATEVFGTFARGVVGIASGVIGAISDPAAAISRVMRSTVRFGKLLADMRTPIVSDPLTTRCTGIGRRLDGLTLSLPRMRRIKDRLGVTLNDLVLTWVAGAVGRYYACHELTPSELSCVVPMSLRKESDRGKLGNHVGAFHVRLPIAERDAMRRLESIRAQTQVSKELRQGSAYRSLLNLSTLVPTAVLRAAVHNLTGRVQLICSNVPGPPAQRYAGGARVEAVYPFAPVILGTPLSIALLSYGDTYCIGIDADPAAVPDVELVRQQLEAEIDRIERVVFPPTRRAISPISSARVLRMAARK